MSAPLTTSESAIGGRPDSDNARYLCILPSSLLMSGTSARIIEWRREIFILAGAMKRMLLPAVTLWLCHGSRAGQLADQRAKRFDRLNRVPRPRSDLGNGRRLQSLCARVNALSVRRIAEPHLTAFGCASDPLSAPTYQISAGAGVVTTGPVGSLSANRKRSRPTSRPAPVVLAVSHRE